MRRRILRAILFIAMLAIGLFAVPLALLVERFVDEDAMLRVERQAILAARAVPEDFPAGSASLRLPTNTVGIRLGVYDLEGRLVVGDGPAKADTATQRALTNRVTDTESDTERIVAVPVSADTQLIAVIRAQQSTGESDARTLRIVLALGGIATAVLAIGAAVGWVMAGRLARPVLDLRDAAVRLGDGEFALQMPTSDIPEIDEAAGALTATAGRLDDLVRRERAFSADASHQLRTPLAGLRAALETELAFPRDDHREVLVESLEDVERLERTISELLTIARRAQPADGKVDVAAVLRDLVEAWSARFEHEGRAVVLGPADGVPAAFGHPLMLRHALDVLMDNALVHGAGDVHVTVGADADTVTISVGDEGPGFARAGDRPDGAAALRGHGLPLATRLVEDQSGRLVLHRTEERPQIDLELRRATTSG